MKRFLFVYEIALTDGGTVAGKFHETELTEADALKAFWRDFPVAVLSHVSARGVMVIEIIEGA